MSYQAMKEAGEFAGKRIGVALEMMSTRPGAIGD